MAHPRTIHTDNTMVPIGTDVQDLNGAALPQPYSIYFVTAGNF